VCNKNCWENQKATCRITKLDPSLTPFAKSKSKIDYIRLQTIKLLEENTGKNFLTLGNNFLGMTRKAQVTKQKIDLKNRLLQKKKKSFCMLGASGSHL
jgi:hypothetical protein